MILGKTILVVVPARGGSKGLPGKNIRPLLGVPLVAHVGRLVSDLNFIDRAVVSSDCPKIRTIAADSGLAAPFIRPEELSGDLIGDLPVLTHALKIMERQDSAIYDYVMMLQPTSPLRTGKEIYEAAFKCIQENLDSVWTVSPTDLKYHPHKQLKFTDGRLQYHSTHGDKIIARQQLDPIYHRNGVAYIISRGCLLEKKTLLSENSSALVSRGLKVSIDGLEDFNFVASLMRAEGLGN